VVFDTCVLCVWLNVAGKGTGETADDRWDRVRVDKLIEEEKESRSTFVLPLATIVETGNHIAQAADRRYGMAQELMAGLPLTLDEEEPCWAAFSRQADLWGRSSLEELVDSRPALAVAGLSLGDATIKNIAEYYAKTGAEVVIATGDQGLKAYEALTPPKTPRRRR
jgi:hypothetical protein